ncbi:unnamed protein product [Nezara viridula]|uniref:Uncharacterized protein n=1 Tax=Nezara viridula TaxID=85310 RepID=A0A9P0H2E4_NEZVI|nr:unnamed protein product [Nezara viridula]
MPESQTKILQRLKSFALDHCPVMACNIPKASLEFRTLLIQPKAATVAGIEEPDQLQRALQKRPPVPVLVTLLWLTMLAACLLLACLPAISSIEYYQQEFSPRMYYYARKIQPAYHERMQYPVKPPFRRPYMVYVPKPYVVEVPKHVPYVKLPVQQQYHFEKQLSHPYRIEKPLYLHQLPTSLETKIPIDFKTSEESPVTVSVEKQVILPVNLGDGTETESKQPSSYMSLPHEVTSHLKLAMNKEQSPLSEFEKESLLKQLNANNFIQETLKNQFAFEDVHKPSSLVTESPNSWSSESKTVLKPIVIPEESQKWTSFNGSEWVPRFRITDIKTISDDKLLKAEKDNFETGEVKFPIQNLKNTQDIAKYFLLKNNNFVPSPALEDETTFKQIPFEQSFLNEHPLKQSFKVPSSKTYQFYNIDSGHVIKPEALTSSIGITEVETQQKDGKELSHQWLDSKGYPKDFYKTITDHSESDMKWVSSQQSNTPYTSQNEPTKKWVTNSEQYVVQTEPVEDISKHQGKQESQKEVSHQWSIQNHHHFHDQDEPGKKWTNGHGQYIIQNESDNFQVQKKDQSAPTINWVKSGDKYIIKKNPDQQWLKTEDTQYMSYNQAPSFSIQEEQGSKVTEDQFKNQKPYSSQNFLLSPQYVTDDSKDTLQPQKYGQQDEKYFHSSEQLEGSFKPLIPSHSQISYKYRIPHSENHQRTSHYPHLQQYNERKPTNQQEQGTSHYNDLLKSQISAEKSSPQTQGDQPSANVRQVYHRQPNAMVQTENLQPISNTNYQQYIPNHQYYQKSKAAQLKTQDAHQIQESFIQPYPQYTSTPQRHGDHWQQNSHNVYQKNTGGGHQEEISSMENYEDKSKFRQEESGAFGQKRRHRQPIRGESGVSDQITRFNRVSITNTTEDPTTTIAPSSTTSQIRAEVMW